MTYDDFIHSIAHKQIPKHEYWHQIVEHKDDILLDVSNYGQVVVAAKLNIHQTKLSTVTQLLKAIHE